MKINDYASDLTRREDGKTKVTVAQMSEILRLLNKDLWGIPYLLIRLKRHKGLAACLIFAALTFSGCGQAPVPGHYEVERTFQRIDSAGHKQASARTYSGDFESPEAAISGTEAMFRQNEPTATEVKVKARRSR